MPVRRTVCAAIGGRLGRALWRRLGRWLRGGRADAEALHLEEEVVVLRGGSDVAMVEPPSLSTARTLQT
jgi:hypothetical protein